MYTLPAIGLWFKYIHTHTHTHTLTQQGFDVNSEVLNGRNALHYAADYGQTDVVTYLCSKGANVNVCR